MSSILMKCEPAVVSKTSAEVCWRMSLYSRLYWR